MIFPGMPSIGKLSERGRHSGISYQSLLDPHPKTLTLATWSGSVVGGVALLMIVELHGVKKPHGFGQNLGFASPLANVGINGGPGIH